MDVKIESPALRLGWQKRLKSGRKCRRSVHICKVCRVIRWIEQSIPRPHTLTLTGFWRVHVLWGKSVIHEPITENFNTKVVYPHEICSFFSQKKPSTQEVWHWYFDGWRMMNWKIMGEMIRDLEINTYNNTLPNDLISECWWEISKLISDVILRVFRNMCRCQYRLHDVTFSPSLAFLPDRLHLMRVRMRMIFIGWNLRWD